MKQYRWIGCWLKWHYWQKKQSHTSFGEYRTISVVKAFLKVLLGLTNKRIYDDIEPKLHWEQAGFINRRNLSDQILALRIIVKHTNAVLNKNVYVTLLDFRKMFDTVWHDVLLFSMYNMGINGRMFGFYKFIYNNLKAKITVSEITSETIGLSQCILQGGESSSTLFNILINDIITELKSSKICIKLYSKLIDSHIYEANGNYDIYFVFIVCLMFANDPAVIAISLHDIQSLVNVVAKLVFRIGLESNPIKCKLLKFIKYK